MWGSSNENARARALATRYGRARHASRCAETCLAEYSADTRQRPVTARSKTLDGLEPGAGFETDAALNDTTQPGESRASFEHALVCFPITSRPGITLHSSSFCCHTIWRWIQTNIIRARSTRPRARTPAADAPEKLSAPRDFFSIPARLSLAANGLRASRIRGNMYRASASS